MQALNSRQLPPLVIATRGSRLALQQAKIVANIITSRGYQVRIKEVKTLGDKIQDRPLQEIGGKGLFIKELEKKLLQNKADIAVHSLKDLPAQIHEELELAAFLQRQEPQDVLIIRSDGADLGLSKSKSLGSVDFNKMQPLQIATGSLRRKEILLRANPNLKILPIRGNIDTRLKKLKDGYCDAVILAKAAINRLSISDAAIEIYDIDPQWFVPCAGQGVIAIEVLKSSGYRDFISSLSYKQTHILVSIERAILASLNASCLLPIGIHAYFSENRKYITTTVVMMSESIKKEVRETQQHESDTPIEKILADHLFSLKNLGANSILESFNLPRIAL
jgi:hydroxymethylbilane synthase